MMVILKNCVVDDKVVNVHIHDSWLIQPKTEVEGLINGNLVFIDIERVFEDGSFMGKSLTNHFPEYTGQSM